VGGRRDLCGTVGACQTASVTVADARVACKGEKRSADIFSAYRTYMHTPYTCVLKRGARSARLSIS
jgi:hypothetical protein